MNKEQQQRYDKVREQIQGIVADFCWRSDKYATASEAADEILKLVRIEDSDQSLPENTWVGNIDIIYNIRLATKQGYEQGQREMIEAGFIKCLPKE